MMPVWCGFWLISKILRSPSGATARLGWPLPRTAGAGSSGAYAKPDAENSHKLVKTLINALFIYGFPSVKFNSQWFRLFQVIRYLLPVNDSPSGQSHQPRKGDFVKTFKALFLSIAMSLCVIAAAGALSTSL